MKLVDAAQSGMSGFVSMMDDADAASFALALPSILSVMARNSM